MNFLVVSIAQSGPVNLDGLLSESTKVDYNRKIFTKPKIKQEVVLPYVSYFNICIRNPLLQKKENLRIDIPVTINNL